MVIFRFITVTIALLALSHAAFAELYKGTTNITPLTANDFKKNVLDSSNMWLVHFYSSKNTDCVQFAPKLQEVATTLEGITNVGVVNVENDPELATKYAVKKTPSIKFFGAKKNSPSNYTSPRNTKRVVQFVQNEIKNIIDSRLGVTPEKKSTPPSQKRPTGNGVVELTDSTISQIYNSESLHIVSFTAPWCGHCQQLKPEWKKAAQQIAEKDINAVVANVDCTQHQSVCSRFDVKGYPTIKIFRANIKSGSKGESYNGERKAAAIVNQISSLAPKTPKAPKIAELTSQADFDKCTENVACVVAFFPDIRDINAKELNNYIETLKKSLVSSKNPLVSALWTNAKKFRALETALEVGENGYPVVATYSSRKKIVIPMMAAFSEDNVTKFITGFTELSVPTGSVPFQLQTSIPKLETIPKWDGKNYRDEL